MPATSTLLAGWRPWTDDERDAANTFLQNGPEGPFRKHAWRCYSLDSDEREQMLRIGIAVKYGPRRYDATRLMLRYAVAEKTGAPTHDLARANIKCTDNDRWLHKQNPLWEARTQLPYAQRLRLMMAVRCLPYSQRSVVWARYMRGKSISEIVRAGVCRDRGDLHYTHKRALQRLREVLSGTYRLTTGRRFKRWEMFQWAREHNTTLAPLDGAPGGYLAKCGWASWAEAIEVLGLPKDPNTVRVWIKEGLRLPIKPKNFNPETAGGGM